MTRNRSKAGKLANECPQRIAKFTERLAKLEKYKRRLRSRLQLGEEAGKSVPFTDEESVQERIDNIKQAMSELKSEIRELEKKLKISRKMSDCFQGKGHRSKFEKLTGRKSL
jgi:flagellar biosynthesis chaperone FliJ